MKCPICNKFVKTKCGLKVHAGSKHNMYLGNCRNQTKQQLIDLMIEKEEDDIQRRRPKGPEPTQD